MSEKVTDSNLLLSVPLKLRHIFHDRVLETYSPAFNELHHSRGGGHDFGEGRKVKEGVHGHRLFLRLDGPVAKGTVVENVFPISNQNDGSGSLPLSKGLFRHLFNGCLVLFGEGLQRMSGSGKERLDQNREDQ
jgi:hypothetical protein